MKRARQTVAITVENKSAKNMLKTLSKKVEKAVAEKNKDTAGTALKEIISAVDKAARKGLIHRNTASRKVSRLTKLVNSILPSEAA
ncbi:MAG: 30S ribosomal protein S20 [Nitrospiraceae bacterium]|nr:MAG: 30S ribosomal protein S20 [Nitrospiraceae bacterium]